MKTASQVRRNRTRPAGSSQRQNQQVSASQLSAQLRQFRHDRARPIGLDLPGIAGGLWDDRALLQYVCSVFACDQGRRVLAAVARGRPAHYCATVDFVEFCWMVRTVVKHPDAQQFTFPMLAGLSGHRTRTVRECLETICIAVQNLSALILQVVQERLPSYLALPFAHALMVTEAVSHRAGFATELDDTRHTRIMRWAERLTWRVAGDSLVHALNEA